MNDAEIVKRIDHLVELERQLEHQHADGGLAPADREQLEAVEVQLDQCWDLLRQRRARRHAGQDPDGAVVRPSSVVEHYQQ